MLFLPFHLLLQEKLITPPDRYSNQSNRYESAETKIAGRKALFIKATACEQDHDWNQAVRHYTRLIVTYPYPVFSSLKAYSRLLDGYAAMNADFKISSDDKALLMEILASPSRSDDQLLLAGEIYRYGFKQVSFATFSIGLANARRCLSINRDTYLSFNILWRIEQYSHDLGQYNLFEQSAKSLLKLAGKLARNQLGISQQQKIETIKRQTYVWLAEIYHSRNDMIHKQSILEKLRSEFPDV